MRRYCGICCSYHDSNITCREARRRNNLEIFFQLAILAAVIIAVISAAGLWQEGAF